MLSLCVFLVFAFVFAQLVQTFGPARPVFAVAPVSVCGACRGRGFVYR